MKKEEVRTLVLFTIMAVLALLFGAKFVGPANQLYGSKNMGSFWFILLNLGIAFLINIIALEGLHVLGAIIGGYSITKVNVLGICIYKNANNKWKLGFKDFEGLTGETRIVPKKDKTNIKPYIWCPLFGYAIEVATCIILYIMITRGTIETRSTWVAVSSLIFILISSLIALYNFAPFKLDAMTDGFRLVLLNKEVNIKAYNEVLKIEDLNRQGKTTNEITVFDEITEYTANLNVMAMYKCLENGDLKRANEIASKLVDNKNVLDSYFYNRILAQKLYIEVLLNDDVNGVKDLYDSLCSDEIRRFIANDTSMESIRAYILIAGMIEESEGEVIYTYSRVQKAMKKTYPFQAKVEEKLLADAIEYVYKAHPKWNKENLTSK